jgi:PHD/YefM family antitoxin component YafN of YafNO toxin-antitoxin module
MDKTLLIQENDQPLAVLLRYEEFLAMQRDLMALLETRSVLSDKEEIHDIVSGLSDIKTGKTKSIDEIRRVLDKSDKNKERV